MAVPIILIVALIAGIISIVLMLMANFYFKIKKGRMIVGTILLFLGLIIIIWASFAVIYDLSRDLGYLWPFAFMYLIAGVFLFVIGLVLLLTSRKKNSKSLDKSIT